MLFLVNIVADAVNANSNVSSLCEPFKSYVFLVFSDFFFQGSCDGISFSSKRVLTDEKRRAFMQPKKKPNHFLTSFVQIDASAENTAYAQQLGPRFSISGWQNRICLCMVRLTSQKKVNFVNKHNFFLTFLFAKKRSFTTTHEFLVRICNFSPSSLRPLPPSPSPLHTHFNMQTLPSSSLHCRYSGTPIYTVINTVGSS